MELILGRNQVCKPNFFMSFPISKQLIGFRSFVLKIFRHLLSMHHWAHQQFFIQTTFHFWMWTPCYTRHFHCRGCLSPAPNHTFLHFCWLIFSMKQLPKYLKNFMTLTIITYGSFSVYGEILSLLNTMNSSSPHIFWSRYRKLGALHRLCLWGGWAACWNLKNRLE